MRTLVICFLVVLPLSSCKENASLPDGDVISDAATSDVNVQDAMLDATGDAQDEVGPLLDASGDDLVMQASDFKCIQDGSKVRKFYVTNPLGALEESLAVANNPSGGTYPVGTVLQLVPTEAMVKRKVGWNAATSDWEFFSLQVDGDTTTILARGSDDVVNAFNGNCFDCHSKAAPQWDLVCEDTHGCDPLPLSDAFIESIQNNDSRCP